LRVGYTVSRSNNVGKNVIIIMARGAADSRSLCLPKREEKGSKQEIFRDCVVREVEVAAVSLSYVLFTWFLIQIM